MDTSKLYRVEKLINKIEMDISRRYSDLDKPMFVETLKKTHEIYDLVLSEVKYFLTSFNMEGVASLLEKIFKGQNHLFQILLKI